MARSTVSSGTGSVRLLYAPYPQQKVLCLATNDYHYLIWNRSTTKKNVKPNQISPSIHAVLSRTIARSLVPSFQRVRQLLLRALQRFLGIARRWTVPGGALLSFGHRRSSSMSQRQCQVKNCVMPVCFSMLLLGTRQGLVPPRDRTLHYQAIKR